MSSFSSAPVSGVGHLVMAAAPDENAILEELVQSQLVVACGALREIDPMISADHMVFGLIG